MRGLADLLPRGMLRLVAGRLMAWSLVLAARPRGSLVPARPRAAAGSRLPGLALFRSPNAPAILKLVEATCAEFGVRYTEHESFRAASRRRTSAGCDNGNAGPNGGVGRAGG